jgi:hypothetical protein
MSQFSDRSVAARLARNGVLSLARFAAAISVADAGAGDALSLASVAAALFLSRVVPSPSVARVSVFLMEFKM